MSSWDSLSMQERADVMKLFVEKGIYNLDTIRREYNLFAEGGGIHIKPSHRGKLTELKARTGKSEAELYNDGNPAHKKMVVFARNARKWKHEDGGLLERALESAERDRQFAYGGNMANYYDGGGLLDWFKGLFSSQPKEPQKRYKAVDGYIHNTKEEAINRNNNLAKQGRAYIQQGSKIKGIHTKAVPRQPNTSSTAAKSMQLENRMYSMIDGYRERVGYRTKNYDIPYGNREIKVKPKGTTLPLNISVNALDSVAKYAGMTGTPIETALGLPMQETTFGRNPLYNYGKLGENYSSQDLGNANYFKNFGSIPAEYLVRDFRYNGDLIIDGKRDKSIPLETAPLQHALEYFNAGKYNTNDKNHSRDVKASGNALWNETTGSLQNWWTTEGKGWYDKGAKQRKK